MKLQSILLIALILFMGSAYAAFVHPGVRSASAYELDFVKDKIAINAEPWASHLNSAKNAGGNSRALGLALNWYLTGDIASAEAAIAALKTWNTHLPYEPAPDNGGNQSSLEGAWAASVLAPAAEILSQYPGWSSEDKEDTKEMFRTVFLPAMLKMSYWNGNVDLTQIDALLSIAVFIEDEAAWATGIDRLEKRLPAYFYLSSDDPSVRAYANGTYNWSGANQPLMWVDGVSQELCRDNGHHAQFAIAAALSALETAYLQGVDLYSVHQERMIDAMELMALQLSSKDMQGVCSGTTTDQHGDGDRYNTLEIGYNHYRNRMGVEMPETWKEIIQELRFSGRHQFNMFHETLTNADIVYATGPVGPASLNSGMNLNGSKVSAITLATSGSILLYSSEPTPFNISVLAVNGTVVYQRKGFLESGAAIEVDTGLETAPAGIYLIHLQTKSGAFLRTHLQ
jgi:hypothetical protein